MTEIAIGPVLDGRPWTFLLTNRLSLFPSLSPPNVSFPLSGAMRPRLDY